jgi:cytochrome c biogenesis factor
MMSAVVVTATTARVLKALLLLLLPEVVADCEISIGGTFFSPVDFVRVASIKS